MTGDGWTVLLLLTATAAVLLVYLAATTRGLNP